MKTIFPELLWITDAELRGKVEATFMDGLAQGGWTLADMGLYAFSTNVPDVSFACISGPLPAWRMPHIRNIQSSTLDATA